MGGEQIFIAGVLIIAVAIVGAAIAWGVLYMAKKRLKATLEKEYGKNQAD